MPTRSKTEAIIKHATRGAGKKRSQQLSVFVQDYFRDVPNMDINTRPPLSLAEIVSSHFDLALAWTSGYRKISVFNPEPENVSRDNRFTVVQVVTANSPFLIDTVMMELNRLGHSIRLTIHPLMHLQRNEHGKVTNVLPFSPDVVASELESFIYMEIDEVIDAKALEEIRTSLERVLEDTRLAVNDRFEMTAQVENIIKEIQDPHYPASSRERGEIIAFLQWQLGNNFIFLGYRKYRLRKNSNKETLEIVRNSGRGILRKTGGKRKSRSFEIVPDHIKDHVAFAGPLIITKSSSRSTVHRPANLDYLGILRYDDKGELIGEHRVLGLYTSSAYMSNPLEIPLVREKIQAVMKKSRLLPDSHASKALVNILQTYPRDELFQIDSNLLHDNTVGILHLQERQQLRLFARRDLFDRFFACIIYIPKEQYHSKLRERIQVILKNALNGASIDFSITITESAYAQLYLVIHTQPGSVPGHDFTLLEKHIAEISRGWSDKLKDLLLSSLDRQKAMHYYENFGTAFPAAYMEDHDVEQAMLDCHDIERCSESDELVLNIYNPDKSESGWFLLKLFNPGYALQLSRIVPILENMGLFIRTVRPYELNTQSANSVWIHSFQVEYGNKDTSGVIELKEVFQDALKQVWKGQLEDDGFNKLVLGIGLKAREVMMLRAYAKYMRQLGTGFSASYIQDALSNNPLTTKLLVSLFLARFSPQEENRNKTLANLNEKINTELEAVVSLDEDRILRRYFELVKATIRSNFFQAGSDNSDKDYLSLKIIPRLIPDLPEPYPLYEIFVYSPRIEGIHLRGGKVARGGLRWSDRKEDFRTEVLGLMKAQMVKNAVIVPVGAKGGFYVKQAPVGDRQALLEEGISCYRTFIRGLLDVTDNRIGERIVKPANVVCYDDDDPYLVVAADKGTASFSDIANEVSAEYRFWLGDAFASGGSDGYDHKKMGITARGAWESVKHNFQFLGINIQEQDFSVVGIGDMAGDVFGNGMLLSKHIRLLAAFNHMHIFLDPDPDAASSFRERKRLFSLPRSSWEDYDSGLISKGGGVYSRSLKSIRLSEQAREVLQVDEIEMSPDDVIKSILKAPVDLIWNGGIGTYVKADAELNMDVGDKTNDNLRINASELRCKVIGEGGNLGFTQQARIQFAENGGRINADWIDNSGGVDCSDREVNIKILLNKLLAEDKINLARRNRLLKNMTADVAQLVLQDNYRQVRAISVMEIESGIRPGWYSLLIEKLENTEGFSRELEHIPDPATIEKRRALQLGFSRPETAVLLAYTKTAVYNAIIETSLPDEPYLTGMLSGYFPPQMRKQFGEAITSHRLCREIIATVLTNSMVNRAGITFAHRLSDETGTSIATVGKAFLAARDVFDIHCLWHEIDKLDHKVPVAVQASLVFEAQHLLRHATRWFIQNSQYLLKLEDSVDLFASGIEPLTQMLRQVLDKNDRKLINKRIREYRDGGIPARTASKFASLRVILMTLELSQLAVQKSVDISVIIRLFFTIGSKLNIHTLRNNADMLATDNVWQDHARVDFIQELNSQQTRLTGMALAHAGRTDRVEDVVEKWLAHNKPALEQYRDIYEKMKYTESNELATLVVVLNKLRNFI